MNALHQLATTSWHPTRLAMNAIATVVALAAAHVISGVLDLPLWYIWPLLWFPWFNNVHVSYAYLCTPRKWVVPYSVSLKRYYTAHHHRVILSMHPTCARDGTSACWKVRSHPLSGWAATYTVRASPNPDGERVFMMRVNDIFEQDPTQKKTAGFVPTPQGWAREVFAGKVFLNQLYVLSRTSVVIPADWTCPICVDGKGTGDVWSLKCDPRHLFHVTCIETWFETDRTCPLCRIPS